MIRPHLRLTLSKYRLLVVCCGLVLSLILPLVQIHASPNELSAGAASPVQENQQIRQLELNKPIERELTGGQSHSYQLAPVAGQYVKLVVDQRGIDVVVKLFGPDGKQITEFDSVIRTQGQETVEWLAKEAGSYRMDVLAKYKNAAAGRIEIQVVELRVATENDRALHEAGKLYAESRGLYSAGKYDEAQPLVGRVLEIRERVLGPEHPDVARALNGLANLYYERGDYAKAEPFYQRAVTIREKSLGPKHPEVAHSLANLAILYRKRGDYLKAEPLFQRALTILEEVLGAEHPDVAQALNSLAILYYNNGDYARAEPSYQRALSIKENTLGPEHPDVAVSLNSLAILYYKKGDYARAEPFYQRALAIMEKARGPEHPDVAVYLNNLATLYYKKGDYVRTESFYQRALIIREKGLGPEHPDVALTLNNLANLYSERVDYAKAELLSQRALTIREKVLGPEHPDVAASLDSLASFYINTGNHAKAEPLYQRALNIVQKVLGPEHLDVARALNNLAKFYSDRGDYTKAEPRLQRALAIMEKALGREHPDVAAALYNLARLYYQKGDYTRAEPFYQRALAIEEKALGSEHPVFAFTLKNLANLYYEKGDYARAESFYQRALIIEEKTLGPEHHAFAVTLSGLANIYQSRNDNAKAEPLYQRALNIKEKVLGPEHPDVASTLHNLAIHHAAKGDVAQATRFLSRANAVDERNLALNLAIGSERQKLVYLSKFSKQTDFTLSLHSQAAPNDPQALNLAFTTLLRRKARGLDAMTDTIATLRRHATPQNQELICQLIETRSRLAALTLKEPDAVKPDTYRTLLNELEDEVDMREAELSSRSAEFRAQRQPITLAAVQAALHAGSALVEFAFFTPLDPKTEKNEPPRYLAYVLPAQGQPQWVDLGETAKIDRAVDAWRIALRDPNRTDVKRLARAVDKKVMRPVRSLLSEMPGDTRRLLIAPDGPLNLIPFAALVDEQNQYLIERYSISYLTSGRDLLRLQTLHPSRNAPPLVVANPDFGRFDTIAMRGGQNSGKSRMRNQSRAQIDPTQVFFQPLPATEDEALAIKALLPKASVLQREEATETALKQASGPRILHIATHGFFLNYQEALPAEDDTLNIISPETTGPASAQTTPYTVQIEATPAFESAQEKVKELKAQGVDAYIVKSEVKGKGTFFRVRAGNFPTLDEARKYGTDLQEKGVTSEFFVAHYQRPQGDLAGPAPTIAGAMTKPANPTQVTASPAKSQPITEPLSNLRLSKFAAKVKNPLLRSGLALAGANHGKSGDDDGVLTAMEAAYLDLSGTKLVVLSACDTGVGDVKNGEGVQGLRRALVLAGSESQVMSLWPVSDEAAKDLMIPYYKALKQGEGRSEGLRQVQLRMLRGSKDRRHPFYWAAFIQSGEWANLDIQR